MNKIDVTYNNFSNLSFASDSISKEKSDENMPGAIKSVIDILKSAQNYNEVEKTLFNLVDSGDLKAMDSYTTFNSGDYYIKCMSRLIGQKYSKMIEALGQNDIKIAPEYIVSSDMIDDSVLITRISGTNGEDLIPMRKGYNLLDDDTKRSAYADVQKLVKLGLINQDMLRGDSCWYIVPGSKKLVIPDWHHLRPIDNNEGKDILNFVYSTLFEN